MIYAIVAEYTDGHTAVQYVDQKAVPATRDNPCFLSCIDERQNVLFIEYAQAIHPERKHRPVDRGIVEIPLEGAKAVTVHNTDEIGGVYDTTPIRVFLPNS